MIMKYVVTLSRVYKIPADRVLNRQREFDGRFDAEDVAIRIAMDDIEEDILEVDEVTELLSGSVRIVD